MRLFVLLALLGVLAGCASDHGDFQSYAERRLHYRQERQVAALEARVLTLVQGERLKIDPAAKPLVLDRELAAAARSHSKDMVEKKYFAHASPEGQSTTSAVLAGDKKFRGLLGENIAAQYYQRGMDIDSDTFAQRFVDSWLDSPEHKANLAYAVYDRTGVGVAIGKDAIYVTQLFATDLGLPEPPSEAGDQEEN